ncbi:MAG: metal-binding protein [Clostridiales bacterium]|nr:metal-binding protein [Clostridiales bacterium]
MNKKYKLIDANGNIYLSDQKGKYGGNKNSKCYGCLNCPSALNWIKKGSYVKYRVFFANDYDALMAGYHPCSICQKEKYIQWKQNPKAFIDKYRHEHCQSKERDQ